MKKGVLITYISEDKRIFSKCTVENDFDRWNMKIPFALGSNQTVMKLEDFEENFFKVSNYEELRNFEEIERP